MRRLIDKIKNNLTEMTESELKIATHIMQFPEMVIENNITDLADKLEVSRNTITRFCKTIGYHGFSEFTFAMEQFIEEGIKSKPLELSTLDFVVDAHAAAIKKIVDYVSSEQMEQLAKLIATHKSIKVIATGKSRNAALQLKYRFQSIRRDVQIIEDVYLLKDISYLFSPDDLVIVFSVSGKSRVTNFVSKEALKIVKTSVIITMTNALSDQNTFTHTYQLPLVSHSNHTFTYDSQSLFIVFIDIIMAYCRQCGEI